jgi:hypothetical protein
MQIFHAAMALCTSDFVVNMTLVIEQNMFGHIIDLDPRGRCLRVEVSVLLLDPWMLFDDIVMAMQTLFYRWYAWEVRIGNVRVTVLALDLFDATVHIMTKRNGLFRPETTCGPRPENINKCC